MSEQSTELVVIHPDTGEIMVELDKLPVEMLAEAELALKERESQLRAMRREIDNELRHRFDDDLAQRDLDATDPKALGHALIVDGFEVRVSGGRERVWDADELEAALRELVDDGVVDARDCVGVLEHETRVRGREAKALLDRLSGEAWKTVRACHSWQRKGDGRGYVRVDRAIALPAPDEQ